MRILQERPGDLEFSFGYLEGLSRIQGWRFRVVGCVRPFQINAIYIYTYFNSNFSVFDLLMYFGSYILLFYLSILSTLCLFVCVLSVLVSSTYMFLFFKLESMQLNRLSSFLFKQFMELFVCLISSFVVYIFLMVHGCWCCI